ncbi:MAG: hypothetical protein JWM11_101 [Planctomycetaceae bacterium]|nr:hypothetical protein [Planctomycetaceae bacterium]
MLGTWIQRDPVSPDSMLNLYLYVLARPVTLYDPMGLSSAGGYTPPGGLNQCISECQDNCYQQFYGFFGILNPNYVGCIVGCEGGCHNEDPLCHYLNTLPACNVAAIQCVCGLMGIADVLSEFIPAQSTKLFLALSDCIMCESLETAHLVCHQGNIGLPSIALTAVDCVLDIANAFGFQLVPGAESLNVIFDALIEAAGAAYRTNCGEEGWPQSCTTFGNCVGPIPPPAFVPQLPLGV